MCTGVFATLINYIDRQILGLLAPLLQHEIGWTQVQYGRIVVAFLASDLFPRRALGAVVGIGDMVGAISGVLFSEVIGQTLQRMGHYWVLFAIAALAYLLAFAILHMLTPRTAPAKLDSLREGQAPRRFRLRRRVKPAIDAVA